LTCSAGDVTKVGLALNLSWQKNKWRDAKKFSESQFALVGGVPRHPVALMIFFAAREGILGKS